MLHADNNDTADNLKKGVLYRSDGSGTNYAVSLENHGYGTIEVLHCPPANVHCPLANQHTLSLANQLCTLSQLLSDPLKPKMCAQIMFINHYFRQTRSSFLKRAGCMTSSLFGQ